MSADISRVVYEESVRAMNQQAGVLDNLRARAATLIAAASLVTGFLGGQALAKPSFSSGVVVYPPLDMWAWVAISTFLVAAACAVWVLLPHRHWVFVLGAGGMLKNAKDECGLDLDRFYRVHAAYNEENYDNNARKLRWLWAWFGVGCAALAVEAIAWLVYLRGGT